MRESLFSLKDKLNQKEKRGEADQGIEAMRIMVTDCNEEGLCLLEGSILPWGEIETIGKCEYLGRELTWTVYYIRKKNDPCNLSIPTLGKFSLFRNDEKERGELKLRLKIIECAQNRPSLRFVVKVTHFGKEKPWDIEKEEEICRYWFSPVAEQARKEYQRQAPWVMAGFFIAVLALLFTVWFISLLS